jgi:acetyl esterase/lipase
MKTGRLVVLSLLLVAGCWRPATQRAAQQGKPAVPDAETASLPEARRGFETKLTRRQKANEPVPSPPPNLFRTVQYDAPPGKLAAYLSQPKEAGKKLPAIIWITGGDCNTIGDVWTEGPPSNDQSASAFRKAGIVMMFPSLRGGNQNPGVREGFFGEVDDVLAAADYLAGQDAVDPQRIYLGGHSTGGTLVLLVAASTDRFRGVFSFGPVEDVQGYGPEYCPFNVFNKRELELRAPGRWLHSVQCPTFVFEGVKQPGNLDSLNAMKRNSQNPLLHFYPVPRTDHFSVLHPVTQLIAAKILKDKGETTSIAFTEDELASPGGK